MRITRAVVAVVVLAGVIDLSLHVAYVARLRAAILPNARPSLGWCPPDAIPCTLDDRLDHLLDLVGG